MAYSELAVVQLGLRIWSIKRKIHGTPGGQNSSARFWKPAQRQSAVSQADVVNMVVVNLLEEFAVKSLHKKEISLVDNSYFSTTKNWGANVSPPHKIENTTTKNHNQKPLIIPKWDVWQRYGVERNENGGGVHINVKMNLREKNKITNSTKNEGIQSNLKSAGQKNLPYVLTKLVKVLTPDISNQNAPKVSSIALKIVKQ